MRAPADYIAKHDIQIPGSYGFGYRTGDEMIEAARVNLGLVVGVDVDPLRPDVMARPADDAERSAWQDYAVVRGVPYAEAVNLDRQELQQRLEPGDETAAAEAEAVATPTDGDRKPVWVDYAASELTRRSGGRIDSDLARVRVAEATKADLIAAFGPDGDGGPAEWYAVPGEVEQVGPHGDLIVEKAQPQDQEQG